MAGGIEINVKSDFDKANRMLSGMRKKEVRAAANSAANKTIRSVRSFAVKLIAKDIGLTNKNTRQYLVIKKSNFRTLTASVTGTGKRIPIHKLRAKQTKRGVTYRGKSGKRTLIPGAFIASVRVKGVPGVYKRQSKQRLDLRFLRGVSIPHVMTKNAIDRAIKDVAGERWIKTFQHELNRRLKRVR